MHARSSPNRQGYYSSLHPAHRWYQDSDDMEQGSTAHPTYYTTTKTLICPDWETAVVPVFQPGTPVRDKRGCPFVPGLATGTKEDLLSRLVLPTGTKCLFFFMFFFSQFSFYFNYTFAFQLNLCIGIQCV